jgi:prepilin-type processing-associated H-X9-DG protein
MKLGSMARASYGLSYGTFRVWQGGYGLGSPESPVSPNERALSDGVFNINLPMRPRDIVDGTTHTMLAMEKSFTATTLLCESAFPNLANIVWYNSYAMSEVGASLASSHGPPQSAQSFSLDNQHQASQMWFAMEFTRGSSCHATGLNVLMGDGSVRYVDYSVESWSTCPPPGFKAGNPLPERPGIWQRMTTRDAGD